VNPLGPSRKATETIQDSLWQIPYYPYSDSTLLKEAISHYLGSEVGPDNIIVGNGSTELIYLFCETFLEKGDSAIIPIPTLGKYENAARRMGGRLDHINLNQGFKINPSDFIDRIDHSTKIIFLCNPNNPTSIMAPYDDLLEIIEAASEKKVLVFLDEDFVEFVDEKNIIH
jgi:threonine-phosphate decarboxylase